MAKVEILSTQITKNKLISFGLGGSQTCNSAEKLFMSKICCIAGHCLGSSDSSRLVLLKKHNAVWCVAQGDNAFSALTWSSALNTSVYTADLKIITTNGRREFDVRNNVPIPKKNHWEITISVVANNDAYIVLCRGNRQLDTPCYWIILGGFSNPQKCVIRRCSKGINNCKNQVAEHYNAVVSYSKWVHVKIVLDRTKSGSLRLSVVANNQEILDYVDDDPFQLGNLNFCTGYGSVGHFRIHNYTYFFGKQNETLTYEFLWTPDTQLCWNIIYSFNETSPTHRFKIKLIIANTSHTLELPSTKGEWRHERIEFPRSRSLLEKVGMIKLIITGGGKDSFAVGDIQQCNSKGDKVRSQALIFNAPPKDLNCQVLSSPGQKLQIQPNLDEHFEDCGNYCTCLKFGIPEFDEMQNCQSVTLCQKTEFSEDACFCSAGFTGLYCNEYCHGKLYGVNCNRECGSCKYKPCNFENGECDPQYGCEDGYRMPLCQTTYPILGKPPAPVSSNFTSVAIRVTDFTATGDGRPINYALQYKLWDNNENVSWKTEGVYNYGDSDIHYINGLQSATVYLFRAVLIDDSNSSYEGIKVPYTSYSTKCDVSGAEDIVVKAFRRNITVNWEETNYACPLHFYDFIIEDENEVVSTVSVTYLPFQITALNPFTRYSWKLNYNKSEVLSGSCVTLEDAPSEVRSLNVHVVNQTELRMSWDVPELPNGIIKYYRIVYKFCGNLACLSETCNPTLKEIITLSTTVDLTDLEPYSKYSVEVAACTVECGTVFLKTSTTPGFGILNIVPELVSITTTKYEAWLRWADPIDCNTIKGRIKGYKIAIAGGEEFYQRPGTYIAGLLNLLPYSHYSASVWIEGEEGLSNYPLTVNFTTKPDVPNQVKNAVVYSYGPDWIFVKWEEPYPPTGELEYYELKFSWKSKIVKRDEYCDLFDGMICGKILGSDGIQENTSYSIQIAAKNKDVDNRGPWTNLGQVLTKEDYSEPPLEINTQELSPRRMRVLWPHPSITRGRLRSFKLQIYLISTGLADTITYDKVRWLTVNEEKKLYSTEVDDLHPASRYSLSVCGVTAFIGKCNSVNFKTNILAPDFGSHLQFISRSVTNMTFEIIIPATPKFMTKISTYIIIVTSEGEVNDYEGRLEFKNESLRANILKEAGIENNKSWIAAEMKPGLETVFTIGNIHMVTSGGHFTWHPKNSPLTPGHVYQVILVAVSSWENENAFTMLKMKHPVCTLMKYTPPGDKGGGSAAVIGWLVLVLVLLLASAALVYYLKKRRVIRKDNRFEEQLQPLRKTHNSTGGHSANIVRKRPLPDPPSTAVEPLPDIPGSSSYKKFSCRVKVFELEQYVKTSIESGELHRQYSQFPRGQTKPWDYGKLPENKVKNRYGNLVAYDETRVKLQKLPGDPFSDYINANYVHGYKSPRFYIATQGPKPNTITDFWRMVWQENVQVIAMLANITENGKKKCEQYWPDYNEKLTYGTVTVVNTSEEIYAHYTFRLLNVTVAEETRKVHQFHFTSWPDHGVPRYTQSLASFLKKLLATPSGRGPVVVHCSAGVGRTGTIILADICLRMAAAEGCIDVWSFQQQIREQRANLVDNEEQYRLVHLVLLECLIMESTSYPCAGDFEKRVQELSESGSLQHQFCRIDQLRWQDEALKPAVGETVTSPSQKDPRKNRNLNIVPGSSGRVYISPFPHDDENSNYINAVFVDCFQVKNQFIVTQFPLESTVCDFWRLIIEKNISVIIVLNEIDEENESACSFWPLEAGQSMKPLPYVMVTKKSEENSANWRVHSVTVTETRTDDQNQEMTLTILHLKNWRSDEKLPPSTEVILELWQQAQRLNDSREPFLVCCLDGATASGFFVAVAFLVEKIKLEQQCDVCQAVRTIRLNREQFIPTSEQFEYLYRAAVMYLRSFQIYANC